jgi:hypothetical protein
MRLNLPLAALSLSTFFRQLSYSFSSDHPLSQSSHSLGLSSAAPIRAVSYQNQVFSRPFVKASLPVSFTGCSFFRCRGKSGAINVDLCDFAASDCIFRRNEGKNAGAAKVSHSRSVTFQSCLFAENRARRLAGALVLDQILQTNIDNTTFFDNSCPTGHAALLLITCTTVKISESRFLKNSAGSGGAIGLFETSLVISKTAFSRNQRSLSSANSELTLQDCEFYDQTSASISLSHDDTVSISNCRFAGTIADEVLANGATVKLSGNAEKVSMEITLPILSPIGESRPGLLETDKRMPEDPPEGESGGGEEEERQKRMPEDPPDEDESHNLNPPKIVPEDPSDDDSDGKEPLKDEANRKDSVKGDSDGKDPHRDEENRKDSLNEEAIRKDPPQDNSDRKDSSQGASSRKVSPKDEPGDEDSRPKHQKGLPDDSNGAPDSRVESEKARDDSKRSSGDGDTRISHKNPFSDANLGDAGLPEAQWGGQNGVRAHGIGDGLAKKRPDGDDAGRRLPKGDLDPQGDRFPGRAADFEDRRRGIAEGEEFGGQRAKEEPVSKTRILIYLLAVAFVGILAYAGWTAVRPAGPRRPSIADPALFAHAGFEERFDNGIGMEPVHFEEVPEIDA